jgi:hypothetical protein
MTVADVVPQAGPSPLEAPASQLLVFGRGVTAKGLGPLSVARALAAREYCKQFPGAVDLAVFSGNGAVTDTQGLTEADEMVKEAQLPTGVAVETTPEAETTFANFMDSIRYFDPDRPIGLLAHRAHMPRIEWTAGKLSLGLTFVEIAAEDFGAKPESRSSEREEARLLRLSKVLYFGAEGYDAVARRERQVAGIKMARKKVKAGVQAGLATVKSQSLQR